MRHELENLSHEQRVLQTKIDELEREVEGERTKKRAAERELNELNISINQKKLLGGQESSKVQWLRDEIVKKNT
jgi:outer membrane murein-binding lipoprotein Lpp